MQRLKVGFVGTSQLSFPGAKEAQFERSARELRGLAVRFGFDLRVFPETLVTAEDAEKTVRAAESEGVDFFLVQCTSFSGGFLAPVLARIKDARLGLWAIPEETNEGPVPFNSFCSINMYASIIGHYLKEYRIPCKWFYGNAGQDLLDERLRVTVSALTAIKNIRRAKVGLVGGIAPGFDDLYFDERKLERRFPGLKINRLHEFAEIKDRALLYKTDALSPVIEAFVGEARGVHEKAKPLLETNARVYLAFKDFIREQGYDGLAVSCWPKFQTDFRFSACSVLAKLNDDGVVAACEGDLPSAISMLILKYLGGETPMLMDLSDFDERDQTVLMWHCGPAPKSFMGEKGFTLGVNYHALPHVKGEEPNSCGIVRDMVFAPGHATIARLTGEGERLFLAEGDFLAGDKKSFHGSRGWLGNLRLNREAISVRDLVNTVLVRRYQHHYPIVPGDAGLELMELAAWLGMELVERVPYQPYLQNTSLDMGDAS